MEAKMEKIEANVVKLEIKVEAEKFDEALKKAYNKNKMHFNVQGFRKGKVPMGMVKKFYGVEVLYDDAINYVMEDSYPEALEKNDVKPVDYPKVDIVQIGEGKEFIYTAEVTVYPEVVLGDYKGLEVEKKTYEVTEEDIENELKSMQEKNSRVETKTEGTVADKDIAVIDFKGFVDGVAFEGGEGKDYPLEIGSHSFIDGFEDQLVGVAVGEQKEVKVTFPENYGKEELNGKDATFEVTVKEIKVKELPALDDDFAKDATEFETIAEVKEDIKKRLEEANKNREESELEEAIITAAIDSTTIDLPQVMVENEVNTMVKDLENRLQYQGLTMDQYMQYTGNDLDKMKDYMRDGAERKVRADLTLEAIAKAENIEVTEEEVKEKAVEVAKVYSAEANDKMIELLMNAQRPALENDIRIKKTIKLLIDNAKIA
ncbi:trigger factor [Clostridium sp. MSJ-8]|uniref:trigger factor n=1 Tax=Clostridium sp. MSJ-8 TaxID=2841510 RepID=UPI001C0EC757|nr:trigger factor [Clostridium sp. MSJ-8]MBU5487497.1 trigger factor [Clostridium sp. MSJ-8]